MHRFPPAFPALPTGSADSGGGGTAPAAGSCALVMDKGTLDCALVEGTGAALLCAVDRLMPPGGIYAVISFREVCVHTATGPPCVPPQPASPSAFGPASLSSSGW